MKKLIGLLAVAGLALAQPMPSAHAVSLATPGTAPAAKAASDSGLIQVRGHGGGGRGFHGGGFRGGGFAGPRHFGGARFHGGPRFMGARHYGGPRYFAPRRAFVGPRFYAPRRHVWRHPHFYPRRHFRPVIFPGYYYGPRLHCRWAYTYYGPRKICRYRPWWPY